MTNSKSKKCRYCAELIKFEATVCKHCGKSQITLSENLNKNLESISIKAKTQKTKIKDYIHKRCFSFLEKTKQINVKALINFRDPLTIGIFLVVMASLILGYKNIGAIHILLIKSLILLLIYSVMLCLITFLISLVISTVKKTPLVFLMPVFAWLFLGAGIVDMITKSYRVLVLEPQLNQMAAELKCKDYLDYLNSIGADITDVRIRLNNRKNAFAIKMEKNNDLVYFLTRPESPELKETIWYESSNPTVRKHLDEITKCLENQN